ncbi:RNA polymerase II transcription factor SIII subunit A-domain-containing protein [Crassisporium funariophilum]|nr:RNA polymerase II transcription factor SIII subunit A-domain-containing protein [Crassisporium funariophilum]
MDNDQEWPQRRIPSLVQLCQRAAVAHVDSICSLGDDLTYSLVKPILERCTTDQLLRFEQSSPHLQGETPEIWKDLCFRKYRLMAEERYPVEDDPRDGDSWRSRYFVLQDAEAKRIDEVGSRLRSQRKEAVERKKEREVKYTDRVPPAKRAKTGTGWNLNPQPSKTLFQKTRSEASKVQKAYNSRILPPMPSANSYRALPQSSGAVLPSMSSTSTRVTVNTVIQRRPAPAPTPLSRTANLRPTPASSPPANGRPVELLSTPGPTRSQTTSHSSASPPVNNLGSTPSLKGPLRVSKSQTISKKDPMASLFLPKRKANT